MLVQSIFQQEPRLNDNTQLINYRVTPCEAVLINIYESETKSIS